MIPVLCSWLMILYSLFFVSPEQAIGSVGVGQPMDLVPYSFEFVPGQYTASDIYVKGLIYEFNGWYPNLLYVSNASGGSVDNVVNTALFPAGTPSLDPSKKYVIGAIASPPTGLSVKKTIVTGAIYSWGNSNYDSPTSPFTMSSNSAGVKLALRVKNKKGQVICGVNDFSIYTTTQGMNPNVAYINVSGDACKISNVVNK